LPQVQVSGQRRRQRPWKWPVPCCYVSGFVWVCLCECLRVCKDPENDFRTLKMTCAEYMCVCMCVTTLKISL
jgi:hypothetical protein